MEKASFETQLNFSAEKAQISVILESPFSKELRIAMRKGQQMKEHQTPFPIMIHLLQGSIEFGVGTSTHSLTQGDIFWLEGGVPHHLTAKEDSVIRLTLSKLDDAHRVKNVAQHS